MFFCGGKNVVSLTDSAAISLAGQLGHAVAGGTFTFNRFLMQRTTTGGEFTRASFHVNDSAFIECPDDSAAFVDGDNDALYLWSGAHGFTNTLIGFTKDDGVDSGGDGSGLLSYQDCWFESTFHEGNSLSGTGKIVNHHRTVFLDCGQALEAGYHGPTGNLLGCLVTGNLIGGRFGDNYDWTYDGFLRATNSLLIYNYRDVWGMNWADWAYRTMQMDVRSNQLTTAEKVWPANTAWNPATVLGFGPDSTNKYRTYYFRKQFIVESVAAFTNLFLEVLRDDGLVVYLNDQDFYRNNLPAGPLAYSDFATNATDNGGIIQSATLPLTALVMDANVLAAEVHQSSASSSDLAFDLQLTAIPTSSSLLLQQARRGGSWCCIGTTQVTNWKKRLKSPDRGRRCLGARLPRLSIIRAANGSFACANRETLWWPPSQRRHVAPVPPEGESSLRTKESFANLLQRHSL